MNFRIQNGRLEIFGEFSEIPVDPSGPVKRCILTWDPVLPETAAASLKKNANANPLTIIADLQRLGFESIGALETAEHIYIFNDWFGRVPLYVWPSNSQWILGDKLIEFSSLMNKPLEFDPISLRQYLWCSYPLGDRSLYKDISVAPPASIFKVDRKTGRVESLPNSGLGQFRFDQFNDSYSMEELRDLFYQAFQRRYAKYPNRILSLSGGQDSRAALVAMENLGIDYASATFYFPARAKNPDLDTAKLLVAATRHPQNWISIPIGETDAQEDELLRLKCGMNYLGVNQMIGFFKQLREKFSRDCIYLTGDGGDKVFPDLRDPDAPTFDALLQTTLKRHALTPVSQVEEWVPAKLSITDAVADLFKSYPEQENRARGKAFVLRERARKAFYEGEDRNRQFFLSSSPFYDTAFFQYVMRIRDDEKSRNALYRKFHKLLSPKFASMPDALGYPADSWRYAFRQRVQGTLRVLPTKYKNQLRKVVGLGASLPPARQEQLRELLNRTDASKYLNVEKLRLAIPSLNTIQYQYLKTLLRLLDLKIVH
jgi:asparagine synthase (glutamine-hydrolysing)